MKIVNRLRRAIEKVAPTDDEVQAQLPGDTLLQPYVLNRGMTLPVSPDELSGWLVQIGKRSERRAGWYLPWGIERWLPRKNRALRCVDPYLALRKGEQILDWMSFGRPHKLTVETVDPEGRALVLTGQRLGGYTWALVWNEIAPGQTRLVMRMQTSKYGLLLQIVNKLEMLLVCYPFYAGLTQRLTRGE